ncbi:hypothetical protein ScPMuIL_002994 [Solemya velum]
MPGLTTGGRSSKAKSAVGSMRKDNNCHVSTSTNKPNPMDDDAHLKISYTPGKKGGNFGLPLGAKLTVPDGVFGKKDSITCQVAPPTSRWRYSPVLPFYEHMTSEIFCLTTSLNVLKKSLVVQIPYYNVDVEHSEINVKGKWKDELDWVDVGFLRKEGTSTPCVELEVDRLGTFVVTFTPKKEAFEITPQGCLYNARLSRYISIRFPKKATDRPFQYENESTDDIAVLRKTDQGSWEIVEGNYKFTRTTVTFDVKTLSRFCVAKAKPGRRKRLTVAVPILEGRADKEKGEVLVFVNLQEKFWFMLVECVAETKAESRTNERRQKGFKLITKSVTAKVEISKNNFRRPPPIKEFKAKEPDGFEIFDGMKWNIGIADDIKIHYDSDLSENSELQYFKYLPESSRRFVIEPRTNDEKTLLGALSLAPIGLEDPRANEAATLTFKVAIDEETVKAYFKPEFVPEEEKPKPKREFNIHFAEPVVEKPVVVTTPRFKPIPQTVMERLMKSNRKPVFIEKESKVLTGRSLMTLAHNVPEGLTLAVHLNLPDSTITGIGFDAIANGRGMSDVTYKILLYWKRQTKDKKDGAVDILTMALREMGRSDIARVVLEKHQDKKELTAGCFDILAGV